jgi:type 1 glutamine amidotransferase
VIPTPSLIDLVMKAPIFAFASLLALSNAYAALPADAPEKIAAALPSEAYAKPAKTRRILIFSVTNGFRHDSIETGQLAFTELGKKTGAFETVVSNDLDNFEEEALKAFDAVCFLNTTLEVFMPSEAEKKKLDEAGLAKATERAARLEKNLLEFIKSGKGYIGIHAATDTCYNSAAYGEMVGGFFDGHPWLAGTQVSIKVDPGHAKHPLVSMFTENLNIKEEIYQFKAPYDSKNVDMLLRLDTEKSPMNLPGIKRKDGDFGVSWVKEYGKGRVFYCSLGHNHDIYWNPTILQHYLAGIQWALGDFKVESK